MKILAVDSTSQIASVAVCSDKTMLASYTLNNGNTHSETLLPMIEAILKMLSIKIDDIDLFACSAGPGSFTGVRIGAATIKGLAFDSKKPCIGVSTLEALAGNLDIVNGIICPVMNARRNQFYTAIFKADNGNITRLTDDSAIGIDELKAKLSNYSEKIYLCGDGYALAKNALQMENIFETSEPLVYQSAYSVAMCALNYYNNGVRTTDAELSPTYLRMPQAERERLEKLNKL